jgi:hypothetical protein
MKTPTLLVVISLLALLIAGGALAQDDATTYELDVVNSGVSATVDLDPGFILDPYLLRVLGGGDLAASTLDSACSGYVAAVPDVTINWSGDGDPLTLFVYSDADPVLVVKTPDGSYLCNDDINPLVPDPAIQIQNAAAGTYEIHVGTYAPDDFVMGFLVITELPYDFTRLDLSPLLERRELPPLVMEELLPVEVLNIGSAAIFGAVDLATGFADMQVQATAGGQLPIFNVATNNIACTGFVASAPTLNVHWSGEDGEARLFFEGDADSTLIVAAPDGSFICADDADGENNVNPVLDLAMTEGTYHVFVGSYAQETLIPGTLTLTSDANAGPAVLPYAPPTE